MFPWSDISTESIGFDLGCGTGRWAKSVAPKGEIVILISGANERSNEFDKIKLISMLREEMQTTSLRDAVQAVTQVSGQPRKKIYSLAIDLNSECKKKN